MWKKDLMKKIKGKELYITQTMEEFVGVLVNIMVFANDFYLCITGFIVFYKLLKYYNLQHGLEKT